MTPTGIDNLLATDLGVVLSCGEELWLADDTLVAQRLLRRFPGARHGCRAMFASAAGGLFVAPDGPDLAASERGLWMSADRGATWTRVIDLGPLGRGATFAALAEDRDGRLFAGLCAPADAVANAMVYRSVDGGSTWAPSPVGAAGCHITDVATDRWSGATYATLDGSIASAPRVVRTTDGGATWDAILFELPRIGPMIIVAGARLFASRELGQARIFRSQDDRTYTTVLDDAIDSSFAWLRRSPSSGTLMAGTVRAGREGLAGIYRSVDDGRAWTLERSLPAPARGDGTPAACIAPEGRSLVATRVDARPSAPIPVAPTGLPVRPQRPEWSALLGRAVAALALAAVAPLLVVAAVAIRATTRGPALYVQRRHGLAGTCFRLYKLRTITPMPSPSGAPVMHIARLGSVLRVTSIDELPQLWNVVRGDMSLVGPRPHPIPMDRDYADPVPELMQRYAVRPGITGLAQIGGTRGPVRNVAEMRRRLELDLAYIRRRSTRLDLRILTRTLVGGFIDFSRRGA